MKIAYIASSKIPSRSANSVHVMKMVQAFATAHDVTLYYPEGEKGVDIFAYYGVKRNFKLMPLRRSGRLGVVLYGLKTALATKGSDFILSRDNVAAWFCALFGPVAFEVHGSPDHLNPVAKWMFYSMKKNTKYIVISGALKRHIIEKGIPAEKIILAADGSDPLESADRPFEKSAFDVGYTGHLYKGRGIEIIAAIAGQMPDAKFHIVGGNDEDIAYWKTHMPSNTIFHGHVNHQKVGAFLQHFDVLLAPYQEKVAIQGNTGDTAQWMSPLKIFEYMASGKPMICSDMLVLREVLRNNDNCVLCAPADPDAWLAALRDLRANPQKADDIAARAKSEFLDKYTWQKRADHILASR